MRELLQSLLQEAVLELRQSEQRLFDLPSHIQIERTKDEKHGDYATNIALVLAKSAKMVPRELAEKLVSRLSEAEQIDQIEIAGPGFINFFVSDSMKRKVVPKILQEREFFGRSDQGQGKRVLVEFVSANPTGPLHVGHGRGAAYGAVISDLLEMMGYEVSREYYVNDAGRQMDILAVSVWLRYLEACGEAISFPSNGYRGDYIVEIGRELQAQEGDRLHRSSDKVFDGVSEDESENAEGKTGDKEAHIDDLVYQAKKLLGKEYDFVHQFGLSKILEDIKDDLLEFGVSFDEWFSEKSLMESGAIQRGIDRLKEREYVYEKEGALWFRSTQFGDEKDRVLIRENGQSTYFASDVAYHWNKIERGFDVMIDVLGADHHGYVPRVRAAIQALGKNEEALRVPLVQFAILYRGKERVPMSTRSGSFVTLRELREEVGNDAARFFYVMRKVEQHMDFDLDLAKSKSNENPVYYIQYAHARICSVFRQLEEKGLSYDLSQGLNALDQLTTSYEKALFVHLSRYPEILHSAAKELEPHQLIIYLRELATLFHSYYNAEKFILDNDLLRQARLCLIEAVKQVFANGLALLGVSFPEKM